MAQTVQHDPNGAPDKSKTYCLMNSDGSVADWFGTHGEAIKAMGQTTSASRHMYSENSMFSLTPVDLKFAEGDGVWIEALQAKDYHTKGYGVVPVTATKLSNLAQSIKDKVRGIDVSTDYEHGLDKAKGSKASGTIKDAKVDGNTLLLNVAFTDTAKAEIKAGEWKYFSSDWVDEYQHDDGTKHSDVLLGGGLTNRPVAKGLNPLPVNFSELYDEVDIPDSTIVNKEMSEESMNELLKKLAGQLGIQFSEDDDETELGTKVTTAFSELLTEVEPLRKLKQTADNQKTFAEMYPEQHAQMEQDRKFRIEAGSNTFAGAVGERRFSESLGKKDSEGKDVVVTTTKGLSALALDKVKETHLKFSEGTVTVEDFSGTIDAILDGGIVDYGEVGTSQGGGSTELVAGEDVVPSGSLASVRQSFAERVTEVQKEMQTANKDEGVTITFSDALPLAAEKYPKMYEAYMGRSS